MRNVIFNIYKYRLRRIAAQVLLDFEDGVPRVGNYSTLDDFFEAFIPEKGEKLAIQDKARSVARQNGNVAKTEQSILKDRKEENLSLVEAHKENVIILSVQTNSTRKLYTKEFGSRYEKHYPTELVIIDNRPGHQFIAVEHTRRGAAMDTERAARIMQSGFNLMMNDQGVYFEITTLVRKMDFYETVRDILTRLEDQVRSVTFRFDGKRRNNLSQNSDFIYVVQNWIGKFASRGQVTAFLRNNREFMQSEMRKDFELIAGLCAQDPHYSLLVKFEQFGLFRYGDETVVQFGLAKDAIDRFTEKVQTVSQESIFIDEEDQEPQKLASLREWLENINDLSNRYEERALSKRERKKSYRR